LIFGKLFFGPYILKKYQIGLSDYFSLNLVMIFLKVIQFGHCR